MSKNKTLAGLLIVAAILLLLPYTSLGVNIPGISEPNGYSVSCQVEFDRNDIHEADCTVVNTCRTLTSFSLLDTLFGNPLETERELELRVLGREIFSKDYDVSTLDFDKTVEVNACVPDTSDSGTFTLKNSEGGIQATKTVVW